MCTNWYLRRSDILELIFIILFFFYHYIKTSHNTMTMTMNIDDSEFLDTKLQGYALIKPEEIKAGDHLRVTQTVYKEPDRRKCGYVNVKKIV